MDIMNRYRTKNRTARGILTLLLTVSSLGLFAQELLTMDRSMDIAVENSPDMQQTELALVQSQERLRAPSRHCA